MEDDVMSVSGYSVASMPNRPYRKKRRAPLPPTSPTATAAASNKTDDDKASVSDLMGFWYCQVVNIDYR